MSRYIDGLRQNSSDIVTGLQQGLARRFRVYDSEDSDDERVNDRQPKIAEAAVPYTQLPVVYSLIADSQALQNKGVEIKKYPELIPFDRCFSS